MADKLFFEVSLPEREADDLQRILKDNGITSYRCSQASHVIAIGFLRANRFEIVPILFFVPAEQRWELFQLINRTLEKAQKLTRRLAGTIRCVEVREVVGQQSGRQLS